MRRLFTRTFLRFFIAFLAIITISCSLLVITTHAQGMADAAAVLAGFFVAK